jgi:DNA-directed RNA polymerase subunit M/transcription elongation factor TFIIS
MFGWNVKVGASGDVEQVADGLSGSVVVRPNGRGGTKVEVKSDSGKWVLDHFECERCGFDRYGTSCTRTKDRGYRVTFTCTECGHVEQYFQREV